MRAASNRSMNEMEKRPKLMIFVKWCVVCLAIAVVCFFIEKPYAETELREVIGKVSNCFTIPGVLIGGIGGLSYVSYLGGYDGLSYAFSNFGLHNLWTRKQPKRYKSLYEYKEAKDNAGRKWLPSALMAGLASIAIGILFTIIYCII